MGLKSSYRLLRPRPGTFFVRGASKEIDVKGLLCANNCT